MNDKYEAVIGLEIHAQLMTKSKAFSNDSTNFGDLPNTNTSPISLGHPGTLPTINEKIVKYAIKAGLAINCKIRYFSIFSRKNYFYHDLPKGYQITQYADPICYDGYINIENEEGELIKIGISRIHIEEDTGKSIHDLDSDTLLDFNRAGVPLLEIVSEPDIRSAAEAYKFLIQMKQIVMYLGICSGNMEEGALRCDVNVSVRLIGENHVGTKTEIKNLNSFRNVEKAIEYEIDRQIEQIESGKGIIQETRLWDEDKKVTKTMRSKEEANDYRYFPEPDLPPLRIPDYWIEELKLEIPEMPLQRKLRLIDQYQLPIYDAEILIIDKDLADYFEKCCGHLSVQNEKRFKLVSNLIINEVMRYMSDNNLSARQIKIKPEHIAELVELYADSIISSNSSKVVFLELIHGLSPKEIIENQGLAQDSDSDKLEILVKRIIFEKPDSVEKYRSGKTNVMSYFVGQIMMQTKEKANPKMVTDLLMKYL